MTDPTEDARRGLAAEINDAEFHLPDPHWTTDEARAEFEFLSFLAPFAVVRRRSTRERGSLEFTHDPRFYFNWLPALPVTADPAILSLQSQAVLHEANVVGWPRAFEGDVVSDARYLDRERPERFVWVLYDNGTQLLPARTPIPFPFAGRNPLDEVEYAEAFLRVYGDGEDRRERDIGARWYVYEEGRLRRVQATEAIERLRSWKKGGPRT